MTKTFVFIYSSSLMWSCGVVSLQWLLSSPRSLFSQCREYLCCWKLPVWDDWSVFPLSVFGFWSCHATASPSNGLQKLTSHETTLGKCLLEGKKVSLQQQDSSCLVFKNVSSSIYCTDRFQASDPLLFDEGLREPTLPFHLQTFRGWTLGDDNLPFSSSSSLCPRCCQSSRAVIPGSIAKCFENIDSSDDSTDSPCASTLYSKSSQRIWSEISCLQSAEIP